MIVLGLVVTLLFDQPLLLESDKLVAILEEGSMADAYAQLSSAAHHTSIHMLTIRLQ